MDQQTAQQIVTATTAVVAALGGAGVTGYINYKNTLKQLTAAKEQSDQQWNETRAVDHERWTRDKKTESYARFLRTASPLYSSNFLPSDKGASAGSFETDFGAAISDVVIFGSHEVVVAAMKYRTLLIGVTHAIKEMQREITTELVDEARRNPQDIDRVEAERIAHERALTAGQGIRTDKLPALVEEFSVLANLMRKDCGIEGEVGQFTLAGPPDQVAPVDPPSS